MFGKLLTFFFPNPCVVCGKSTDRNRYVCEGCQDKPIYIGRNSVCKTCLSPIPSGEALCGACLLSPPRYHRLVSSVYFDGAIRTSLHRYKFRNRPDFSTSFAKMMCERLTDEGCTDFDLVIPVPLSKERYKERGYNQSALLAKEIAAHFGADYNDQALIRKKETVPQSSLAHKYRAYNVRGAFALTDSRVVSGKHLLLVDDIFTTGETVRAAVYPLAKHAARITVCTVARAGHINGIMHEDS